MSKQKKLCTLIMIITPKIIHLCHPSCHPLQGSPSTLNQIMSHKAQNSSFLILFHFHQLKLPKTPPNGKTIEKAKGGCDFILSLWNTKPRNIQGADISNFSLHIISYIVFLRRTTYLVQFSFLFLFHYRP